MNTKDKLWLVKSKGHVLGPYAAQDIEGMLKEGEISLEDSLCRPKKMWRKVSDYQNFQKIVKFLRDNDGSLENTSKQPLDDSHTETVDHDLRQENTITQEIQTNSKNKSKRKSDKSSDEIVIDDVDEVRSSRTEVKTSKKSFGYIASEEAKSSANSFKNVLWKSIIGVLLVVVVGVVYKKIYIEPEDLMQTKLKLKALAIEQGRIGNYQLAKEYYEKLFELDKNDFETILRLGIYYIQLDKQNIKGQEMLKRVINRGGPSPKFAFAGVGLSYHNERAFSEAIHYYNKSLGIDKNFAPSLINIGSINLERGDFKEARKYFKKAISAGEDDLGVNIYEALAVLGDQSARTESNLAIVQNEMNMLAKLDADYSQEARFISIYIDIFKNDARSAFGKLDELLDTLPDLTEVYRKGIFINRNALQWTAFYDWCMEIAQKLGKVPRVSALKSLCHFKTGNLTMAKIEIEKAVIQDPKDPLLQAFFSRILEKQGLNVEASVAMGTAVKNNSNDRFTLPNIIQAEFCRKQKDFDCAEKYWMKVLASNKNTTMAITGLAELNFEKGELLKSKTYFEQVVGKSKNYKPFLVLSSEMKNK